jgi:hypothetical protein
MINKEIRKVKNMRDKSVSISAKRNIDTILIDSKYEYFSKYVSREPRNIQIKIAKKKLK